MTRIAVIAAVVLVGLGLAGCSASSNSGSVAVAPHSAVGSGAESSSSSSGKSASASRSVVTTGTIDLVAGRPSAVADHVATIVDAAGGRLDGRDETAAQDGDNGTATLTLRIPSAKLDATVAEIRTLGTVKRVSIATQDVTADVQDLDARIDALRASVARLTDLLSRASSTDDLVSIESALSQRQSDLESLESQQRALGDQVDLATITLAITSPKTISAAAPGTFLSGLVNGWNAFVAFFGFLLVALGILLPWLLFGGIVTAAVLVAIRLARRWRNRPRSS